MVDAWNVNVVALLGWHRSGIRADIGYKNEWQVGMSDRRSKSTANPIRCHAILNTVALGYHTFPLIKLSPFSFRLFDRVCIRAHAEYI